MTSQPAPRRRSAVDGSLDHPCSPDLGLRLEVIRFKRSSPRGLVPPAVWVGSPGGTCEPLPVAPSVLDWSARIEVATALCERLRSEVPAPVLWITRSGPLDLCSLDSTWWATTRAAWEEVGLVPAFAVVTRQGWRLLPEDRRREWRRVRDR